MENYNFYLTNRFYGIYDFVLIYLSLGAGLVGAIVRFILSLVIALITVSIVDQPNLPAWFLKYLWLDGVNKSYLGMIYMYHIHNHPIHVTFAQILSER